MDPSIFQNPQSPAASLDGQPRLVQKSKEIEAEYGTRFSN